MSSSATAYNGDEIAIISLAGRFPGAQTVEQLWHNLRDGLEAITFFTDEELQSSGLAPALISHRDFVKAGSVLKDIDLFDAAFFGFSPREAELMDPQHRLFLECAWEALESAGYNPETYPRRIGVYGSVSTNSYLMNLYSNPELLSTVEPLQILIGNEKDHLGARLSYKLNLKGPSVCVQTACSSSLVAVHLAGQSLLNGECEMALAGGVTVRVPQQTGYLYKAGGIASPDGHCRAFDAKGEGSIGGNGAGIVLLKRLEDALAEGDNVLAVIKGSAVNNDGALRIGYTAPSVRGQAEAISEAMAMARVDASDISYVEAHGTATTLGDPIEIAALTKAYRASTEQRNYCAIGSVKTNLGHLDVASGVTGLIKTVLALQHEQLPPSLHYENPNPQIDFDNSPFYVNDRLRPWKRNGKPRRAGISSFGTGGTNAHVILEEAPQREAAEKSVGQHLLLLSARSETALEKATDNLVQYLKQNPSQPLADVAYTLQVGRRAFEHCRMLVCRDVDDAVRALESQEPGRVFTSSRPKSSAPVVFMFPGQGAQQANMTRGLYESEPVFRAQVDRCAQLLRPVLNLDLREVLYPENTPEATAAAAQQLRQTSLTQPALFVIEYALAKLWVKWGVRPEAMIGHSLGEYVAACLAGVFSLEDALKLVAARGRLMQQMSPGAMLAVPLSEEDVRPLLGEHLSLAAVNTAGMTVVSGRAEAVAALEYNLAQRGVECRRLQTSHAFHSAMMEPLMEQFTREVEKVRLTAPQIPYLSTLTGRWITEAEATSAVYWVQHMRQTVRFADAVAELLKEPSRIFLEVGPGRTLSTLVTSQAGGVTKRNVLSSLGGSSEPERAQVLSAAGRLWLCGVELKWPALYGDERRRRIPLPTYPFERQRYWVEPQRNKASTDYTAAGKKAEIADWFYLPSWKRSLIPLASTKALATAEASRWLLFLDECELGAQIVARLEEQGHSVITVRAGELFTAHSAQAYTINPQLPEDYHSLIAAITTDGPMPTRVMHLWGVTRQQEDGRATVESFRRAQDAGFFSLLWLAQMLGRNHVTSPLQLAVVSNDLQEVTGKEHLAPEKSTVLSPCKIIPQEYLNITCRSIDVELPPAGSRQEKKLVEQLIAELFSAPSAEQTIAYRGAHRWAQHYEAVRVEAASEGHGLLREEGVYLITGGVGGVGLVLAQYLAQTVRARLVLTGRSPLPERDAWQQWLERHTDADPVSRKIRKVQELESYGAQVMLASVDVADRRQMQELFSAAERRFGRIDGLIHAAGNVGDHSFMAVEAIGKSECEWQLHPKVYGLMVLEELLENQELDFCMMVSSLSTILGGLGLVGYSAANAYLDALAHKHHRHGHTPWISVNWDGWYLREGGDLKTMAGASMAELAILPLEGAEVFERVLSLHGVAQVAVSTADLEARLRRWIKLESVRSQAETEQSSALYARPSIDTAYVEPRNEIEERVAEVWQGLLGIERPGVYDNFFELGGHSLMATQLVSMLRETFSVDLPMRSIFETPTIAQLALAIAEKQAGLELSQACVVYRDPVELHLVQLWEDLLGKSPIQATDNFFELGGTPLQAEQLMEHVARCAGQEIPLSTFLEEPTVRGVRTALYEERGWPWNLRVIHEQPKIKSSLIEFQPDGTRRPFFCVAPLGGLLPSNIVSGSILNLKPHLDGERPFYGLQLPGLAQDMAQHFAPGSQMDAEHLRDLFLEQRPGQQLIAEASARCLKAMREVQPEGPYLIGGFCSGGLVAFELACQLRAQGEQVSMLALIDSSAPTDGSSDAPDTQPVQVGETDGETAALTSFIHDVVGADRLPPQTYEYLLALKPDERWQYVLEQARKARLLSESAGVEEAQRLFSIFMVNQQSLAYIMGGYRPAPYEGQITLILCQEMSQAASDPTLGWGRLSSAPVAVHVVAGHHKSLMGEPHVKLLAQWLTHCLDQSAPTSEEPLIEQRENIFQGAMHM